MASLLTSSACCDLKAHFLSKSYWESFMLLKYFLSMSGTSVKPVYILRDAGESQTVKT